MCDASAADTLLEALGLEKRTTAEVQDLYSRPLGAGPVTLRLEAAEVRRESEPVTEPDREAA